MPDLVWQDDGDLLDQIYLQTLKAGGTERERERETSACIRISFNLEKYVSVLKMILGDASRAHPLLRDKVGYSTVLMLCMLSIACPNLQMAFRWRADDGPTLNAGLVVFRRSGPVLLRNSIFL